MGKAIKKCIIPAVIILVIAFFILIFNWNDIIFFPVEAENVTKVTVTIKDIFDNTVRVVIREPDSIKCVIESENIARKADGVNHFLHCTPWHIEYLYTMDTGKTQKRSYDGQKQRRELMNKFLEIPQIADKAP